MALPGTRWEMSILIGGEKSVTARNPGNFSQIVILSFLNQLDHTTRTLHTHMQNQEIA